MTVAGVIGGTLGLAVPAQATDFAPTNCDELINDLGSINGSGGIITANFTGNCDLAEGYVFQSSTTITGPTNGSLNLRFMDSAMVGFRAQSDFAISNLNFTRESGQNSSGNFYFIDGFDYSAGLYDPITVSNSTFSNAALSAAIYAEGNLTVSDSAFTNLTSYDGGAAIFQLISSTAEISNSTFTGSSSMGQGSGGAINSNGALTVNNSKFNSNASSASGGAIYSPASSLTVNNSSFESNQSQFGDGGAIAGAEVSVTGSTFFDNRADSSTGGGIFAGSGLSVNNSTFVNNRAADCAAMFSEGGLVANSTLWNNTVLNPSGSSISLNSGFFFGNILANSDAVQLIASSVNDLGANLFTDSSFVPTTNGVGSSKLVSVDELKLKAPALNQTTPTNIGTTKTVAIGADSIAKDYYSADSAGINPTADSSITTRLTTSDQRGAIRPFGAGYDVGAYERGNEPAVSASTSLKSKIHFKGNSAILTKSEKKKLNDLAKYIVDNKVTSVNLSGFTATATKAASKGHTFRLELSHLRAKNTQKYLAKKLKKRGYTVTFSRSAKGSLSPVKSNKSESGRKANRRVEIEITQ